MTRWLLNLVWLTLLATLAPWLVYRRVVLGKQLGDWRQKFLGQMPRRTGTGPCVWLHAVSVGEVLQLPQIIAELRRRTSELEVVVSVTTSTGHQVACQKLTGVTVVYWPLDFSWAVSRAIARLRPSLVVLVELELWPNFLLAARRHRVPVALINGRITPRSVRGYRRIRPVAAWMLSQLRWIAAQSSEYATRLIELGAPTEAVAVTGSVKFDGVEMERNNPRTRRFRALLGFGRDDLVFLAGSTHPPEEQLAIEAWQSARRQFPQLRLLIAPRHAERFEEVARLIRDTGLPLLRRSTLAELPENTESGPPPGDSPPGQNPVILLDSLGELSACWGLADVAFVGGSLTNRGGQSMIEPAAFGVPLLYGPNTWNFQEFVTRMANRSAARVVMTGAELTQGLITCLSEPDEARRRAERGRELVLESQGATRRTVDGIVRLLPTGTPSAAASPGSSPLRAA